MKLYLLKKTTKDWSNCYYEGDTPSYSVEIIGMDTERPILEHKIKMLQSNHRKDMAKRSTVSISISYNIDEIELSQSLLNKLSKMNSINVKPI